MIQWQASLDDHSACKLAAIAADPSWNDVTLRTSAQSESVEVALWLPANASCAGGFCMVSIGPFDIEIEMLAVAHQWRRRGVARQLVAAVQARLHEEQRERLLLEVRASNAPALALYRQCGFVLDGCRGNYYPTSDGGREDALLMSWNVLADNQ